MFVIVRPEAPEDRDAIRAVNRLAFGQEDEATLVDALRATLAERLKAPFSGESFMALELVPGALDGIEGKLRYPPPFGLP